MVARGNNATNRSRNVRPPTPPDSSMLYSACSKVASAQSLYLSQATRHAELEAIDQRLSACGGSVEAAGFAECAECLADVYCSACPAAGPLQAAAGCLTKLGARA